MARFTTLSKDLTSTTVFIQGARKSDASNNIGGILFQNYDDDTKAVYALAEIAALDHYGNNVMDGYGDLKFSTCTGSNLKTERMRLDCQGRLGIGTPTPSELLEIRDGNIAIVGPSDKGIVFKNPDGSVAGTFTRSNLLNSPSASLPDGSVTKAKLDPATVGAWDVQGSNIYFTTSCNVATGNVGIGTDAPHQKLSVHGNIHCTNFIYADSDARLKEDIQPIENGLEKVLQLRGYTYRRKGAPASSQRECGVLAQELERVLPEAVTRMPPPVDHGAGDDDGGFMSVAYGHFTSLLLEAIRDLNAKVDRLLAPC